MFEHALPCQFLATPMSSFSRLLDNQNDGSTKGKPPIILDLFEHSSFSWILSLQKIYLWRNQHQLFHPCPMASSIALLFIHNFDHSCYNVFGILSHLFGSWKRSDLLSGRKQNRSLLGTLELWFYVTLGPLRLRFCYPWYPTHWFGGKEIKAMRCSWLHL